MTRKRVERRQLDEVINVRFSERILSRMNRVIKRDGNTMSEFVRLATLRAIEKAERMGVGDGA